MASVDLLQGQQGFMPLGEHLIRRCRQWFARREMAVEWCSSESCGMGNLGALSPETNDA